MKLPFHHNAHEKIFKNARLLKSTQTEAEKALWRYLRNRKLCGKKFRRQHPIGSYIVDFYCYERQLVIEIDGHIHETADIPAYDTARTNLLESLGLRVVRFSNDQVLNDTSAVLSEIRRQLISKL